MSRRDQRRCPLCNAAPRGLEFPYQTTFKGERFSYLACSDCRTVFVDPVPSSEAFRAMYEKAHYHDVHYDSVGDAGYRESVALLATYAQTGAVVLDYGCGTGEFMKASNRAGFRTVGVDFDGDVAKLAGERTGSPSYSPAEFESSCASDQYDVVHLGDVLEHLPEPFEALSSLAARVVPGGVLFIEGPLETNPSPVHYVARTFGRVKRLAQAGRVADHPPTHLFLTDSPSQLRFFRRLGDGFRLAAWTVEESGWPYAAGGMVKRIVARSAVAVGGKHLFGRVYGNRFRAVFIREPAAGPQADL